MNLPKLLRHAQNSKHKSLAAILEKITYVVYANKGEIQKTN